MRKSRGVCARSGMVEADVWKEEVGNTGRTITTVRKTISSSTDTQSRAKKTSGKQVSSCYTHNEASKESAKFDEGGEF